jgi:hypothetical protein
VYLMVTPETRVLSRHTRHQGTSVGAHESEEHGCEESVGWYSVFMFDFGESFRHEDFHTLRFVI